MPRLALHEHRVEQFPTGGGDRGTPGVVIQDDQVATESVDDHASGFLHDEHRTRVVPHAVRVDAEVGEPVERTARDGTDVER